MLIAKRRPGTVANGEGVWHWHAADIAVEVPDHIGSLLLGSSGDFYEAPENAKRSDGRPPAGSGAPTSIFSALSMI